MSLLANKTVLVTAGVSGLGLAFTKVMADHGAAVGIHYRSDGTKALQLAAEINHSGGSAVAVQAELLDAAAVKNAVATVEATLGPVDTLINNASIYLAPRPACDLSWEDIQAEVEGSLKTAFHATQAVLPGMLERGHGRIIMLIGTMTQRPAGGYAAHNAGKGALLAYTKTLAKEVGPKGIAVHMISPGMALTPNVLASVPEDEREKLRRKTPNRHLPTPEELAGLAVFLASDLSSSATALHLNADGGLADLG